MFKLSNLRCASLPLGLLMLLALAACSGQAAPPPLPQEQPTQTPTGLPVAAPTDTAAPVATRVEPTDPPAPTASTEPLTTEPAAGSEYEIVTLLSPDAIPSIDDPQFYSGDEADAEYGPTELVLGVEQGGEAKAYSISLLSRHEIVNDSIGGKPIAVTW
jgi:hypothetical protein